jgi:hypothetical protein
MGLADIRRIIMRLFAFSVALLLACDAFAAQGRITGSERTGWETGYYNVVVAAIADVKRDTDQAGESRRYRATIVPKATLGGAFDSSLYPALPVVFYVGKAVGAIEEAPPDGALVLVVLQLDREEAAGKPFAFIFSDICKFMPGEAAMVVINSLDDPRVVDTLKRLQDARAHPDPKPNVRPANKQPAADKR